MPRSSGAFFMFRRPDSAHSSWLLLPLLLALVAALYLPGLSGPFLFDDFSNFLRNPGVSAYAAGQSSLGELWSSGFAGPLGRPLAVLSLAWQFRAYGPHPFPFKLFNLLVHLLNTGLVWWFALQLARLAQLRRALVWATLGSALWAVHPLALTPVLYVVQRMTGLSSAGILLALNCALAARARLQSGKRAWPWLALGFPVGVCISLLSKETGALIPVYLLVLEYTLLRASPLPAPARATWRKVVLCAGWLPVVTGLLLLPWLFPVLVRGYQAREFDLGQRLLTEGRVVWIYVRLLMLPSNQALGLYHDDVPLSTGWLMPWTTLPALLGWLVVCGCALSWRRRAPWFAFAVGMFLTGQLLESTLVPLELMHEHRAYLGMLGPILAAVMSIARHVEVLPDQPAALRRALLLAALPLVLLCLLTAQRVVAWSNPLQMAEIEASHHPASVRAQFDLADVYDTLASRSRDPSESRRLLGLALAATRRAIAAAPGDSKPWLAILLICSQSGAGCAPPPEAWQRLDLALRTDHRAHLMLADAIALVDCAEGGACRFPPGAAHASLAALAGNPQLPVADRPLLSEQFKRLDAAEAARALMPANSPEPPG